MSSLIVLQGRPYHNFINSLKSVETKQAYQKALLRYPSHYKTTLENILTLPVSQIENMLIDYLMDQKTKDLSSNYINLNFCTIKHFYFMNDVRINKEKIGRFLGESKKKHTDRGYTTAEIKSIFDLCDLRLKVVVLTLASTSMRIGALTPLKLSNIEKKEKHGVYKFTIYENTKDESICFCSPECATYIDAYLDYRTRAGERLNPQSPFIREQFDVNDIEQVRKQGRSVSKDTISNILLSIVTKAGLRKTNHNFTGRKKTDTAKPWLQKMVDGTGSKRKHELRNKGDANEPFNRSGVSLLQANLRRDSGRVYESRRQRLFCYQ